ncbi:hypothetical protein BDZ94DRAFT_1253755 [Collybia nuda]|uniref:Uncharacterized protein n=1 Tax=Collybia nuda TaxID=64659 RepID=A0A9P5Y8Q4_9AGAR|nr:hypothetical protein BDZ94DRAFT_1253755 [Collybia nuda]
MLYSANLTTAAFSPFSGRSPKVSSRCRRQLAISHLRMLFLIASISAIYAGLTPSPVCVMNSGTPLARVIAMQADWSGYSFSASARKELPSSQAVAVLNDRRTRRDSCSWGLSSYFQRGKW